MERMLSIETKMGESGGTGKEVTKMVKNTMEQLEGRIEERIGKGLESYAAVTQKTQKQEPIMMKEIIKEAMAQQAEEEKDIERRNGNVII